MTRFQLRRLALQATRRPELLPVLQDALLESELGPEFAEAIETAHEYTRRGSRSSAEREIATVVFYPDHRIPFEVFTLRRVDFVKTDPGSWLSGLARRGRVPVYMVARRS